MKINFNNNDNKSKELEAFFNKVIGILKRENFEVLKFTDYGFQVFLHTIGHIDIDKIEEVDFEYDGSLKMYGLSIVVDEFQIIRYFKKLGDN